MQIRMHTCYVSRVFPAPSYYHRQIYSLETCDRFCIGALTMYKEIFIGRMIIFTYMRKGLSLKSCVTGCKFTCLRKN